MSPNFDPIADFVAAHGGEAVFGKRTSPGLYGTNGSVEAEYEWAHLFVSSTGGVVAQMKDRTNPQGFKVGQGIYGVAREMGAKLITSEQWFVPDEHQPGLGKMSRAWVQDADGVTYLLMASEQPELRRPSDGFIPWKVEAYRLV